MNFLNKKNTEKLISNEQGQGAVEYILLLTVIIAVIVGLIFQFNKNFADYADNYFGNYLECLLKSGELPSLGVQTGAVTSSSCNESFKPFTLAEGRPPVDDGSKSESDRNKTSDGKGNKTSPKKFSSNSGGSSGRSRGGGSSARSSGGNGSGNSFPAKGSNNKRKKDKIVEGVGDSASIGKLKNQKRDSDSTEQKNSRRVGKFAAYDPEKEDKEKGKVRVRKNKNNDDELAKKSKSFRQAASIKKNPELKINDDISLGDYLRYLIIAAILIVLLFVVGGQIFQATKGSE